MPDPAGIPVREFARRDGCSHTLVQKAIKTGHITAFEDGTVDPALVGTGWRAGNRRDGNDGATPHIDRDTIDGFLNGLLNGKFGSQATAERIKENALAGLRALELQTKAGALVDRESAEAVFFEVARAERDAWMNWPSRIGPVLAAEFGIPADKMTEALTRHVHAELASRGDPEADFTG